MLFKISVFKELDDKRTRLYTKEISAADGLQALEQGCVKFAPDRIIEIRMVEVASQEVRFERPPIRKAERDGI